MLKQRPALSLSAMTAVLALVVSSGCVTLQPATESSSRRTPAASDFSWTAASEPVGGAVAPDGPGPNVRVNTDASGFDQGEPTVALDPGDSNHLVAASIDARLSGIAKIWVYASFDGGRTWANNLVTHVRFPLHNDPALAFCADRSVVLVSLGLGAGSGVFVYRSTDGGRTWGMERSVAFSMTSTPFYDKPWIACGAAGPYANRIWAGYKERTAAGDAIRMKYSDNFGATWSAALTISDDTARQKNGIQFAQGPGGALYAQWLDFPVGQQMIDRSTNGGATWGTDVVAANITLIQSGVSRISSLPAMDVDRTAGPHSGTIYIAWTDAGTGDPDVLLVRSVDDGLTWSSPLRVNDDLATIATDQAIPAVAVDPKGRVVVTFVDQRRHPGRPIYEEWGAISRDGGVTFDTNFLISDQAFPVDSAAGDMIGDYYAIAAGATTFHPVWGDLRTTESDIYTEPLPNRFDYDEVDAVRFLDRDRLSWDPQDSRFAVNLDYDIAGGLVSQLRADGGYASAACRESFVDAPPWTTSDTPPDGDSFWYLVRARGPAGVGTWGDARPESRPNVRDPLDESAALCP